MTYSPTAFQATHLWQRVCDKLGLTKGLVATGGSATTIADTNLSDDYQDYSDFQSNYAFVRHDAAGAGAAPEGEVQLVTGFTATTKTLTTNTFSSAIGAGDVITLVRGSLLPLNDLKRVCSLALQELGDIPNVDETITTANNQTEHSVPTGILWDRIIRLEIQGDKDDANDQEYSIIPSSMWRVIPPSSEGGTATLVIPQFTSGYTVRVVAIQPHVDIFDYDDDISKAIHPALAVAAAALECAWWKKEQFADAIPLLQNKKDEAMRRYPVKKFIKSMGGIPHWNNTAVEDKFTYPEAP